MGASSMDQGSQIVCMGQLYMCVCALKTLLQLLTSAAVGVYGVLFMDWKTTTGRNEEPFGGVRLILTLEYIRLSTENFLLLQIRQWFFGQLGSIWTTSLDTPPRPGIAVPKDDSSQDAKG